jgi:hypothetical protein
MGMLEPCEHWRNMIAANPNEDVEELKQVASEELSAPAETATQNAADRSLTEQREQEQKLFAEIYQLAGVLFHAGIVPRRLLDKLSAATSGSPIPEGNLLPFDIPAPVSAREAQAEHTPLP